MGLFKKLVIAISLSTAMLAVAPSVIAKPLGKIENQKPAETKAVIDEVIVQAEITLEAIKAEGDVKDLLVEFKKTKQIGKKNESATTYRLREKALGKLGKSRLAYKRGKQEESLKLMEETVTIFKDIKVLYTDFMK